VVVTTDHVGGPYWMACSSGGVVLRPSMLLCSANIVLCKVRVDITEAVAATLR
jgi:hypothetical protein